MDRIRRKMRIYSQLEKKLFLFVLIFAIAGFVLFICLLTVKKERPICYTRGCINAAHHILNSVDETVDPCEDFYTFSCGNFLKDAIARNMYSSLKHLDEMKTNHLRQVVMEDLESEDNLTKSFRYQREYYRTCMNTTAIEEDEDKTFLKLIKEITGGWPLSQGYTEDLHWPEVMVRARERGFKYNFFLDVDVNIQFNHSEILHLEVRLPPEYNFEEHVWRDENLHEIMKMAEHWGDPIPSASWEARKTIEFAKNLSALVERTRNETKDIPFKDKKTTIGKLKNKPFLRLHWLQFFQNITGLKNLKEDDTVIFNVGPDYFKDLYYLIQKTQTKFWTNYIVLLFITSDCDYLSKKMETICKKIRNSSKHNHRRDFCFEQSQGLFEGVAEAHYIRKVTTEEKRKHIKEIIKNIKRELTLKLQTNKWMDEETKVLAIDHLKNVTEAIGWIEIVFNEKEFEKRFGYDKLELNSSNIIEMYQQLSKFYMDFHFKKVGFNASRYWEAVLSTPHLNVNAYYIKFLNILILVASILYPPIYDANRPEYMNYGSLGSIIGHELTHAFSKIEDTDWLTFGKTDDDFWSNQTHENYDNEKKCLIEEYENYTLEVSGKTSNGSVTLNENVADFTGVNLAYLAYQKWVDRHGTEDQLPGLKFTPNQLFWIMASTYMCTEPKLKDPERREMVHSAPSFRVIGPMRNSPYFGKDFGCPVGSKMNPKDKCRLFV